MSHDLGRSVLKRSPERQQQSVSPQRLRDALAAYSGEFLVFSDEAGAIVVGAGDGLRMLGYGSHERTGRHIAQHLHPDDLPKVLHVIEQARHDPMFRETIDVRARHADGHLVALEATVMAVPHHPLLGKGAVLRVRSVERDPTDLGAESDSRFLGLAEALPSGILSSDARGSVVYCNGAAQQILDLPADRIHDQGWLDAVAPEDLPDVMEAAGLVIRSGTQQQATFRIQTGLFLRWASVRFVPLGDPDRPTGWIATIDDVTDRRRAESQLAHRATHDPLTELPNRTLLEDRLEQACARLGRGEGPVTVLFLDLDDFKGINDRMGHKAGDEVLREVARRLRAVLRPSDTIARLGGDEFVAVCEGLDGEAVGSVVERITAALTVPMLVSGQQVLVCGSIGAVVATDGEESPTELLARADQAMYREKRRAGDWLASPGDAMG
jgi:diguanylate cyclase (GGDEF)-like protein/PAS domain S-box-containing protein